MKKILCAVFCLILIISSAFAEAGFSEFSTYDMEGNTVTQDIFSDYDLTVVNIWATWCQYCIYEMPELAKLKTMLPENVNFISICDDATLETIKAYEILESSGSNFQTLMATRELKKQFLDQVYAYPSTFFIDSNGQQAGEAIFGVPSMEDTAQTYFDITMEVLEMMNP